MLAEERFAAILGILKRNGAASVAQLCVQTGASEATVRRDLAILARQGRLCKVRGGAVALDARFEAAEPDMAAKAQLFTREKERIARYAAAQVQDEDFVFLDAGTTILRMVEYLGASRATFVTSGIGCARRLVEKGLRAYVLGGLLKPGTEAVMGAQALQALAGYNFSKAFLGMNGVAVRQGFTTPDREEACIKAKAAEQAYLAYVLVDASKFGKVAAATVCPLEKAHIITDWLPDEGYRRYTVVKEVE